MSLLILFNQGGHGAPPLVSPIFTYRNIAWIDNALNLSWLVTLLLASLGLSCYSEPGRISRGGSCEFESAGPTGQALVGLRCWA